MGNYQLFVLGSLGLIAFVIVILSVFWRKKFRTMQGMMISMFFGMNVGLTAGVLLGATYQGNLFLSTTLSMVIGVVAGTLCGVCFGILPVLEGVMAGLMGGMMGAMLGEMIRVEQSLQLIRLFLFLSIGTIFIMVILKTSKNSKIPSKKWLLKPILLSSVIAVYLIGGNTFVESSENLMELESLNRHHSVTTTPTENPDRESQLIVLETADMKYSANEIIVEKDREVSLTLTNLDQFEHDIEIKVPSLSLDNRSQHNHGKENNVIHLHAAAKSTETLTFTPVESGIYEFICTVPGHKESGMVGKFIVD
ncbi:plastocyanin/azurin family copper-binding protein [Sporosarcina beigongshangi]|uniref:plastocyanin/azurin family copper-binding protein n=1 Tax=Sporosarcina beigongshangi TaxID=2782538 RepID=UPI0019396272|nr:plastocyanin/azurin family copper-binding protein [Sporosarcina beigongshangi]